MYVKDFEGWCRVKSVVSAGGKCVAFSEREIWFSSIGVNIGDEQDGKGELFLRPVLVVRKLTRSLFIGVPLTSKKRAGSFFVTFSLNGVSSCAILAQVRVLDSKRLNYRYAKIGDFDFQRIRKNLINLI